MKEIKQRIFILFFLFKLPVLVLAQGNIAHWLTIEQADYELCNLSLNILHQPTLADEVWIAIQIENKDSVEQKILVSNLEVKIRAYDTKTNDLLKEGMFTSSDPSELLDGFGQNPLEIPKLNPGTHTISHYLSTLSSAILEVPLSDFIRTEISIHFILELKGSEKIQMEWNALAFEFGWYKPNLQQTNQIKNRLNILLADPQNNPNIFFVLKTLLNQENITKNITEQMLISSLKNYEPYPSQKLAILRHINTKFSTSQIIKDYYKSKIEQRDINCLNDLKELPSIWDNDYIELFNNWLEVAPLNVQIRIYDVLFLRQEKWLKHTAFCTELSNILLNQYGDILYQLPKDLNDEQLQMWGSLATALGKSGDASAIGIICPFLENKKNLWGREMVLFTESLEAPRSTRVCDIALEAILHLQHKNKNLVYEKNGFSPPYIYGEAEVIIEKVRNNLILELLNSDICSYKSR